MNDDGIIKECDRLMSTADVKYTITHLELAIKLAKIDAFQDFDGTDRNTNSHASAAGSSTI